MTISALLASPQPPAGATTTRLDGRRPARPTPPPPRPNRPSRRPPHPASTRTRPSDDRRRAFPVTVEHALGSTTIEAEPQRVVTVGVTEQDTVLALGVIPVGVTDWYGDQPYATWPWAQDELGDAEPEVLLAADGFELRADRRPRPRPDHRHQRRARRGVVRDAVGDRADRSPTRRAPTLLRAVGRPDPPDRPGARQGGRDGGDHRRHRRPVRRGRRRPPRVRGRQRRLPPERLLRRRGDRLPGGPEHRLPHRPRLRRSRPSSTTFADRGARRTSRSSSSSVLDDADVLLWGTESPEDRAALGGGAALQRASRRCRTAARCSPTASRPGRSTSPAR